MLKLFCLIFCLQSASSAEVLFSTPTLAEIVTQISPREPFSGTVAVKHKSTPLFTASLGLANREHGVGNTADKKFLIASMSKQFTAAAIYILESKGKIHLEDLVTTYLPASLVHPSHQQQWGKLRIRDLLNHQAGLLKDVQSSESFSFSDHHALPLLVAHILDHPGLLTKQYGQFSYSNVGYILLARIVEVVSKFNFDAFLSYYIFKPLKMDNTGTYHRSKVIPNMVDGYAYDEDGKLTKHCCSDSSNQQGSHNLYSTTGDLLVWIDEIFKSHHIIPEAFVSFLYKNPTPVETDHFYANGLFLQKINSHQFRIWHDGFDSGFTSLMSYYPEKNLTIVILSNRVNVFTTSEQIKKIHDEIVKMF
jgi:CubicO group peptidase (beta-lactamase class C family)